MNSLLRGLQETNDGNDEVDFEAPSPSPSTATDMPTPSPTPITKLWGRSPPPIPTPTMYPDNTNFPSYPTLSGSGSDDDDGPNFFILGFVLVFIFLIAWAVVSNFLSVTPNTAPPATGRPQSTASSTVPATLPTTAQDEVNLVRSMTLAQRREYVANFLRAEKFAGQGRSDSNRSGTFVMSQSKRSLANDDSAPSYAICLEAFRNGEDICTSQNKHCPHQFHLLCAFDWLLTSQECPCCRRDYLSIDQPSSNRSLPRENEVVVTFPAEPSSSIVVSDPPSAPQGLTPQEILSRSVPPAHIEL